MTITSPSAYKTQNGLLKAIARWSDKGVFRTWQLQNTIRCLIDTWGWEERLANRYCMGYHSPAEVLMEGFG